MKKITLRFGAPKEITNPGMDGVVIRFPFTEVDTDLIGSPEEKQRTTNHHLKVTISRWVTTNWKMEENEDLTKVIFEIAKRKLIESLQGGGQLKDEFEVKITTQTHTAQLPFDPDRIQWPDGTTVSVEIREPLGFVA